MGKTVLYLTLLQLISFSSTALSLTTPEQHETHKHMQCNLGWTSTLARIMLEQKCSTLIMFSSMSLAKLCHMWQHSVHSCSRNKQLGWNTIKTAWPCIPWYNLLARFVLVPIPHLSAADLLAWMQFATRIRLLKSLKSPFSQFLWSRHMLSAPSWNLCLCCPSNGGKKEVGPKFHHILCTEQLVFW